MEDDVRRTEILAVWSVKQVYPVKGAFPSMQDSHTAIKQPELE